MSGSYRAWAVDWIEGEHRSKGTEYSVGVGPSRKNGHKLEDDQVLGTFPAPSGQTYAPDTVLQSVSPFLLGTPNEIPQMPAPPGLLLTAQILVAWLVLLCISNIHPW